MDDTHSNRQLFPTPVSPMIMYLKRYAYDDISEKEWGERGPDLKMRMGTCRKNSYGLDTYDTCIGPKRMMRLEPRRFGEWVQTTLVHKLEQRMQN